MSQVKTFTEMESHEEKLHKMIIQSKINDTKDVMKRKAMEIDKVKVDRHGGGRGGGGMGGGMGGGGWAASASLDGIRIRPRGDGFDDGFDARGGAGGYGGSAGDFGGARGGTGSSARDAVSRPAGPSKGLVLGGKGKQNKFLESLRAEGEAVELEPSSRAGAAAARPGGAVGAAGGRVASDRGEDHVLAEEATVGWRAWSCRAR